MDQPTRRFDPPEDAAQVERNAATRRLEPLQPPAELRCLRCGGPMIEMRAWAVGRAFGANDGIVALTLPHGRPSDMVPAIATCCSMTCTRCGYTELYADTDELQFLLLNQQLQDAQRAERKRKSRWT